MPRPTKYDQFEAELLSRIRSGVYTSSQPLPSEHNLCKEFKLSRSTVRKALSNLKDNGVIASVGGKGYFVLGGGAPEELQGLREIGVVMGLNFEDWSLTHLPCMLYTLLEERLAAQGKKLIHTQPEDFDSMADVLRYIETFPGNMILMHWGAVSKFCGPIEFSQFLYGIDKKVVFYEFSAPVEPVNADVIYHDCSEAINLAVRGLYSKGIRNIYYAGFDNMSWSLERRCSFLFALRKVGLWDFGQPEPCIDNPNEVEVYGEGRRRVKDPVACAENAAEFLKQHPEVEAVIFGNDQLIREVNEFYDLSKLKFCIGFDNDYWTRDRGISSISLNLGGMVDVIVKVLESNSHTYPRRIAIPMIYHLRH